MADSRMKQAAREKFLVETPGSVVHEPHGDVGGKARGGHPGMASVPLENLQPVRAEERQRVETAALEMNRRVRSFTPMIFGLVGLTGAAILIVALLRARNAYVRSPASALA